MRRTYSQMHSTDKYSQHSSIIWSVWPNLWVSVYQLSASGFESSCSHLTFRFRSCFGQETPWYSGNYRVWIHFETRTQDDKNIQVKMHLADKYSEHCPIIRSVCWNGWVFVCKLSGSGFECSCSHLNFRFCTCFEEGASWHSLWNAYVTWQEHTVKCTVQVSTQNTAQSFGRFGQMVECLFTN